MIEYVDGDDKNKKKSESGTPVLDNFSKDLIKLAEQGKLDPVIGRQSEIFRIAQILSRRKKNNPIVLGEPGCGKTAIIEGLAKKIFEGDCPQILSNKRIVSLDMKVIDIQIYRERREQKLLEKQIGEIAITPTVDSARKIKVCFTQWIKNSYRR